MTLEELKKIIPYAGPKAGDFLGPLNEAMARYEINTPARQAAFLAQIAHESGSFKYVRELASGKAYEGRKDLGNTKPGDGVRFKGRGLIQITGRANYRECSIALFGDPGILIDHPEMLETVTCACDSAAWFWSSRKLNEMADEGSFRAITRAINGGYNGYADRLAYFQRATQVLT